MTITPFDPHVSVGIAALYKEVLQVLSPQHTGHGLLRLQPPAVQHHEPAVHNIDDEFITTHNITYRIATNMATMESATVTGTKITTQLPGGGCHRLAVSWRNAVTVESSQKRHETDTSFGDSLTPQVPGKILLWNTLIGDNTPKYPWLWSTWYVLILSWWAIRWLYSRGWCILTVVIQRCKETSQVPDFGNRLLINQSYGNVRIGLILERRVSNPGLALDSS